MARLKTLYNDTVAPKVREQFGITNVMQTPKLEKIVVNRGVGKALENKKRLTEAVGELAKITGQQPVATQAKKSIANFKLREGNGVGCKVTLRGDRMYEFRSPDCSRVSQGS